MKTLVACFLVSAIPLFAGCPSGDKNTYEDPKDVIDRTKLGPGEKKHYTIPTTCPAKIGLVVMNESKGGLVTLKQAGKASQASASYWAWISREWVPENGTIELELTNNAKNELEVVVFQGNRPPAWAFK